MSNEPTFTENDIINIARGFDSPPEPELLRKLLQLQREQDGNEQSGRSDLSDLEDLFRKNNNERDQGDELER